jgi:TonB-dependent SusC/RagA subfamily outer membrane receptor
MSGGGSELQRETSPSNRAVDINPEDRKCSCFKDAASTVLYGSRGASGVILITTKKVRKEKSSITFNSSLM